MNKQMRIKMLIWIILGITLIQTVTAGSYVQLKPSLNTHNTSTVATDPNIVGNWWFEQNTTNMADPTVNNGTWSGADGNENVSGIVGGGYLFDGVNDYVTIPYSDSLNITTKITISAWVYLVENRQYNEIVMKKTSTAASSLSYQLVFNYGTLRFAWINAAGTNYNEWSAPLLPTLNKWHHIVASVDMNDNTTKLFYMDGVDRTSEFVCTAGDGDTCQETARGTVGAIAIGTRCNAVDCSTQYARRYFNGTIDEVMIWNRSLSSAEISAIYNTTLSGYITIKEPTGIYVQLGKEMDFT